MTHRQESIAAIRALRLASHQLTNVCRAIVGGTEMGIALTCVSVLAEDAREVQPVHRPKGELQ